MSLPPLHGIRVLEFAGLAPAPFCGLLCADYGADVIRIDRVSDRGLPTNDILCKNKRSICLDLKNPTDISRLKQLVKAADVLIEPFRPGVLEKLGLGPEELLKENERLIYARLTGFRRDGKYKDQAGHDINYLAVSGALAMLGTKDKPIPPANILGDFAGGGAACFQGILLALYVRERTGKGQIVESNMVDASAYLTIFPRLLQKTPMWDSPRGTNLLDGGAPFYDTYKTADGKWMAVGALEPQFFKELMKGLNLPCDEKIIQSRIDKSTWPALRKTFEEKFLSKSRLEWEAIFDGTDACCTPILSNEELEAQKYENRAYVKLSDTPSLDSKASSENSFLIGGQHQEEVFAEWLGAERGSSKL